MFSGFRTVVETLAAPQPRRLSMDTQLNGLSEQDTQSQGPSHSVPSSQLTESALSNLHQSLVSRRPASPDLSSRPPKTANHGFREAGSKLRLNLEERLRANFTIGEASNGTTPSESLRPSPVPLPETEHTLSPESVPLPDSPPDSPTAEKPTLPVTSNDILPHSSTLAKESPEPDQPPREQPVNSLEIPTELEDGSMHTPSIPLSQNRPSVDDKMEISFPEEKTPHGSVDTDLEALQQRLKLLEQRFSDVSASYQKLQAERLAADQLIREFTPLEGVDDDALRDYLRNAAVKAEASKNEIERLNVKLNKQEARLEELREIHRLDSASQSDEIKRLRRQVDDADALIQAFRNSASQASAQAEKNKTEISSLKAEIQRIKGLAKDEEEKRVKAISLLKTVRAKLVKAEKEKEDALKELSLLKGRDTGEKEKEKAEREKLQNEIATAHVESEKAMVALRAQFDQETAVLKERSEKEMQACQAKYELEATTAKNAYVQELSLKDSQITSLRESVDLLTGQKKSLFDDLQSRQAELESSQYRLDELHTQIRELQYQLREANERLAVLNELAEARHEQGHNTSGSSTSAEDVAHLLYAAESKYEAKIAELRQGLASVERERNEADAEWSRKFREKVREIEDLRRTFESSAKANDPRDELVSELKAEIALLRDKVAMHKVQDMAVDFEVEKPKEIESSEEDMARIKFLELQIEEFKAREAQARMSNKALREELRKVQSSAAILERQRSAGPGLWPSRRDTNAGSEPRIQTSSASPPQATLSQPSSPAPAEDINLEYVKNVVLQFLEHKEMRPNLVRVLSAILQFTPQETRQLLSKVQ